MKSLLVMLLLTSILAPNTLAAQTEPPPAELTAAKDDPWRLELGFYIWLTGITGDIGVRGFSADVDATFVDLVQDSSSIFATGGRGELWYDRIGFYFQGYYADLGADDETGRFGLGQIDLSFQQTLLDFGVIGRAFEWASSVEGMNAVDLYVGGRYNDVDVRIEAADGRSRSRDEGWTDLLFGARVIIPFAKGWSVSLAGDIGGFSLASDFTWSATGAVSWEFATTGSAVWSLYLGGRAVGWDYSTGSGADAFEWDVIEYGPIIGVGVEF